MTDKQGERTETEQEELKGSLPLTPPQPTETRLQRNITNGMWLPGNSGNPKGRPKKGQTFLDKYRKLVEAESGKILEAHLAKLKDGDVRHFVEMMNRLYGVPKQTMELQTEDDPGTQLHTAIAMLLMKAGYLGNMGNAANGGVLPPATDAEYRELDDEQAEG